ncbi:YciI family protein [Streptomyces fractus]|uniref:YciI family protein n=1 Tax=Streptomyces fractus TaxID=641806 RepID=UPI003CF5B2E7
MAKFVLLSYLTPGAEPTSEVEGKRWMAYHQALKESGVLLSNAGMSKTDVATTVRVVGGDTQVTDGPGVDSTEYLAGYFLLEVADRAEAQEWAAKMPNSSYGPVEVRPVWY